MDKIDDKTIKEKIQQGYSIYRLSKIYNVSPTTIKDRMVKMGIRSKYEFSVGGAIKEWKKLNRVNPKKNWARTISIPVSMLMKANIDPDKELYGRWVIYDNGKLILEIKESNKSE